jgi:hypothetical protein
MADNPIREALKSRSGGSGGGGSPIRRALRGEGPAKKKKGGGFFDGLKNTAGGIVGGALDALDTAGAAVRATTMELADLPEYFHLADKDDRLIDGDDRVRQTGFSLRDIFENTRDNVGVGEYIEASDDLDDLPMNVKRTLGFAGDVALDPLTYLTAGVSTAGKGGVLLSKEQVARRILDLGDDVLEKSAREQLANQVLKRGGAQAPKEILDELDLVSGLRLGGRKTSGVVLPGTQRAARGAGRAGGAAKEAVRELIPASTIEKLQPVPVESLRRLDKPGRLGELEAFLLKEAPSLARSDAARLGVNLGERLRAIREEFPDVDPDDLRRAIEDPDSVKDGAAKALADLFEEGRKEYERITGKKLPKRENYLTHILTPEGRKKLEDTLGRIANSADKETVEFRRTLEGTIDDINQAVREKYGVEAVDLFETNPWGIADAWVQMMQRATQKGAIEKKLADLGLAEQVDAGFVKKAQSHNAKVQGKADKKAAKAAERQANALDARATAADLRTLGPDGDLPDAPRGLADQLDRQARRAESLAGEARAEFDSIAPRARELAGDRARPTDAQLKRLAPREQAVARARAEVDDARSALDAAKAEADDAAKALKAERDRLRKKNARAAGKVERTAEQRYAAERKLRALQKQEQVAKQNLANAKRAHTLAKTNLEKAKSVPVSAAPVEESPELRRLLDREASIDGEIAAARQALDEAEAGLERLYDDFAKPTKAPPEAEQIRLLGEQQEVIDAAKAQVDALVEEKQFLPEDIEYARSQAGGTQADATQAVDTTDLEQVIREAGLVVDQRAKKAAAATAAREDGEAALSALDGVGEAVEEQVDPALVRARDEARARQAKAAERKAKAEAVLADRASAFDVARASMERDVEELATANRGELARLQARMDELGSKVARYEQVAYESRVKADELFAAAAEEPDPILRQVAKLEAHAAAEDGKAATLFKDAEDFSAKRIPLDDASVAKYQKIQQQGFKQLASGDNMWAHPEVADAVLAMRQNMTPQQVKGILKAHDAVLARWKAWALIKPGYHSRNFMGAMFNNGLAGMDGNATGRAYYKFGRAKVAWEKGGVKAVEAKYGKAYADAFGEMMENRGRLFDEAVQVDAADALAGGRGRGKTSLNPLSMDFAAVKGNFWLAGKVEKMARGPLFIDGRLKGLSVEESMERVVKFHFDYQELSPLEKNVFRRIIPFYTWQRKNFPLQLEMIARKPGLYTRYIHAKRNLELGTEDDSLVPDFFKDMLAIRTDFSVPWAKDIDGGEANIYLTPDLPFTRLTQTFDVGNLKSQINPLFKVPYEVDSGEKAFSGTPFRQGLQEVPDSPLWQPLAAILQVADGKLGLPKVERHADGRLMMSDSDLYKMEQFLPILGQMRRQVPSEDYYQDRALTSWLSYFGVGSRTLSKSEQEAEQRRIDRALQDYQKRAKELGRG